ncbi:MAG: hypothetical protein R3E12_03885 [Candidatus Eisenbacteria bacterium]
MRRRIDVNVWAAAFSIVCATTAFVRDSTVTTIVCNAYVLVLGIATILRGAGSDEPPP